jgi:hypothetical protein
MICRLPSVNRATFPGNPAQNRISRAVSGCSLNCAPSNSFGHPGNPEDCGASARIAGSAGVSAASAQQITNAAY